MFLKLILNAAMLIALAGCSTAPNSATVAPPLKSTQQAAQSKILRSPVKAALNYQIETYQSDVMGGDRTYGVVLPPGYEQHPEVKYPIVFLLHGGHGDPTAWFIKGKALTVIEKAFATGKLPPSIIITPDGNDSRGSSGLWDPQYINGEYGNVLSAIGDELVQVIKSRYRTRPEPEFWAIGGLSSGGWGAMNVGLHHPQNFKTLFSHSGYFIDKSGYENSPIEFVRTLEPEMRRSLAIYLDAGSGDGKYLAQSEEFHQVLNELQVENKFNEFPGGHGIKGAEVGWGYWHKHLADSLTYVGDRFRQAETVQIARSTTNR